MNRIVLGALGALLLVAAGLFWWQGRATNAGPPPAPRLALDTPTAETDELPDADGEGLQGPALPQATEQTREQKRFDRLDRDRDGRITRNEMLAPRVRDFRKLDVDGNNLLSFEEWAVKTADRFKTADANGDQSLTRTEFATTKPKMKKKQDCACR
ncbi:hypothetical protein [Novosphingobium sp. LASN5T]|uniref:hypothetical protein n=1 Tax=Novosphingobium sp. LASN5T TaxID=2491021 RepID=UPI000F5F5E87|nr:hypothetical protein [Novosphingobium sp. LASN5T]RQW45949.1 hypothetical protein EH199_00835 [Novosphingobium sp. LASN5T]